MVDAERQRAAECGSKQPYLSQQLAFNAALLHSWAGRPGMVGYKCSWCPDYHIGHPTGSRWRSRPQVPAEPPNCPQAVA